MSTSSGGSRLPMGIPGGVIALLLILGGIIGAFAACTPSLLPSPSATATAQAVATARAQATATAQVHVTATAQARATATARASATVQAVNATKTVTAILAGNCPAPSDVALAIGVNASLVSKLPLASETCAFTLPKDTQRTVHCPTRYDEVSFQYISPIDSNQYIRKCDGTEATPFQIYGATVRFVNWEPPGDACTVWPKSPGSFLASGTTCPAIAQSSCLDPSVVAQAIGDDASHVSSRFETCGFKLLEGIPREVHCPTGYSEVSFQYTPGPSKTQVIRKCDGTETTSFQIYGGVVRFVKWEPDGDACTVYLKSPGSFLAPGTTCPARS